MAFYERIVEQDLVTRDTAPRKQWRSYGNPPRGVRVAVWVMARAKETAAAKARTMAGGVFSKVEMGQSSAEREVNLDSNGLYAIIEWIAQVESKQGDARFAAKMKSAIPAKCRTIKSVKVSYMMVVHTHDEIDQRFSVLTRSQTLTKLSQGIEGTFKEVAGTGGQTVLEEIHDVSGWMNSYLCEYHNHVEPRAFLAVLQNVAQFYRMYSHKRKEWTILPCFIKEEPPMSSTPQEPVPDSTKSLKEELEVWKRRSGRRRKTSAASIYIPNAMTRAADPLVFTGRLHPVSYVIADITRPAKSPVFSTTHHEWCVVVQPPTRDINNKLGVFLN
ncbi:hypothetical protein Bbelb_051430 [Branchiostoma belcheri]|nr:hypothetical protein Bbelb_051430 [Branchiostoma belcheri]